MQGPIYICILGQFCGGSSQVRQAIFSFVRLALWSIQAFQILDTLAMVYRNDSLRSLGDARSSLRPPPASSASDNPV